MDDLSQTPCFFLLSQMQNMISFIRQTAFVLAEEHPSGTKFINFPHVERFLDKSDVFPCSLRAFKIFRRFFNRNFQLITLHLMLMLKLTGRIRRLAACSTPCDLFRDMLTYMLLQNDRTCQRVIKTINV